MRERVGRSATEVIKTEAIYLDANATVRPLDCVVEAVTGAMREAWGNPSSEHTNGIAARRVLTRARDAVAALLPGIEPEDVMLTSGGTEASNTILATAGRDSTLIISAVEHPATMRPAELARRRGANLIVVPVDAQGQVDPDAFAQAAVQAATRSVYASVQWANGETGVIQAVAAISAAIYAVRPDASIHLDAAQAVGRIPTPVPREVTGCSFSGHKLHGPQGIGVLALSSGADANIAALIAGGGQERGLRSGTPERRRRGGSRSCAGGPGGKLPRSRRANARATRCVRDSNSPGSTARDGQRRKQSRIPNTQHHKSPLPGNRRHVAGGSTRRCGDPMLPGVGLLIRSPGASHVLRAMGIDEESAYASVRFSFSILNTEEEVERAAKTVCHLVKEKG